MFESLGVGGDKLWQAGRAAGSTCCNLLLCGGARQSQQGGSTAVGYCSSRYSCHGAASCGIAGTSRLAKDLVKDQS